MSQDNSQYGGGVGNEFGWNEGASCRLLRADRAVLLVVDIQARFVPVIHESARLLSQTARLIQGCGLLDVPVMVTEQYPQGLGATAPELMAVLPASAVVLEKAAFGCGQDPQIAAQLAALQRPQVLVCGIEAHICVNQTVHQLLAQGYQVHCIQDAISARQPRDYDLALRKMEQAGAIPSGVEMALFELLAISRHPQFKAVQALVK